MLKIVQEVVQCILKNDHWPSRLSTRQSSISRVTARRKLIHKEKVKETVYNNCVLSRSVGNLMIHYCYFTRSHVLPHTTGSTKMNGFYKKECTNSLKYWRTRDKIQSFFSGSLMKFNLCLNKLTVDLAVFKLICVVKITTKKSKRK